MNEQKAIIGTAKDSYCWIWKDRQFQPVATIPIQDRGFRYGMSVFETVGIVWGKALLIPEHLQRLKSAAEHFQFPIESSALHDLSTFLESIPLNEGLLRIYWTAGDGGAADPFLQGRLILLGEKMAMPGCSASIPNLSVTSLKVDFTDQDGWKTGNYLMRCRLLAETKKKGFQEALLYDPSGLLVGAIMANVFLVSKEGRLFTPKRRPGCRDGAVRGWVMSQYEVEENSITAEDITSANEVFLTNSRLGIATVLDLAGQKLEPKGVAQSIASSYLLPAFWKK